MIKLISPLSNLVGLFKLVVYSSSFGLINSLPFEKCDYSVLVDFLISLDKFNNFSSIQDILLD